MSSQQARMKKEWGDVVMRMRGGGRGMEREDELGDVGVVIFMRRRFV